MKLLLIGAGALVASGALSGADKPALPVSEPVPVAVCHTDSECLSYTAGVIDAMRLQCEDNYLSRTELVWQVSEIMNGPAVAGESAVDAIRAAAASLGCE